MTGRRLISDRARVRHAQVRRTSRLTARVIRVVLGMAPADFADLNLGPFTDHYVKLLFPRPGVRYPEPFDLATIRESMPRDQWPLQRTYTIRSWDADAAELAIDFVYHGDVGVAARWAARAIPGDPVRFLGPGGGYRPDPAASWHLFVGDESAFPAIAVALSRLPATATARVFLEVDGPADEQPLAVPPGTDVVWVHRAGRPVGERLVRAVYALPFPPGTVDAFVHGEAHFVKALRRFLRIDLALPRHQLSISGYWRAGTDEDGWQAAKPAWNRQLDAEEHAARTAALTGRSLPRTLHPVGCLTSPNPSTD